MSQHCPSTSPVRDILRAKILKSPSPLRPTAERKRSPSCTGKDARDDAANVTAERLTHVNQELKELRAMYRKVVEAHRLARADIRTCDDRRQAAERRADAAEAELQARDTARDSAVESASPFCPETAELRQDTAREREQTDALWKAVSAAVEPSVLNSLRKKDIAARTSAYAELECNSRAALWDALRESVDAATLTAIARSASDGAQQPTLPVSVACRLFEPSGASAEAENTLPQFGSGAPPKKESCPTLGFGFSERKLPQFGSDNPKTIGAVTIAGCAQTLSPMPVLSLQRRASTPAGSTPGRRKRASSFSGGTGACNEARDLTPPRSFQGVIRASTPPSSSVRDRIRALESCGR